MALRICITDKDQKVLNFVEQFGSITINQTRKMFYNTQKYGYDIARRRLKKLVTHNKLRVSRDLTGNENVYYTDKKLSYHDLLVLDYYASLIYNGSKIVYFKQKQPWLNGKIVSDAYCCYVIGNKVFFNILEVVRTHGIDKDKYMNLFKSGEPQRFNSAIYEKLGGDTINEFPRIVVVDNVIHSNNLFIHEDVKIHQLNFGMGELSKIFV